MAEMREYTLTVREVMENLASLAESYETVSRGGSPTGNYFFAVNVAEMAASLKAANVLISQLPSWIPVEERLPGEYEKVVVFTTQSGTHVASLDEDGIWFPSHGDGWMFPVVTHWMPLPAEPPTCAAGEK